MCKKCKEKKENKRVKYIEKVERDIAYFNKPICKNNVDEIGMDTHVEHLESAIEKQADIISIVSGYGTGKSSLIELLKEKYNGCEREGKIDCERVYCQINLWSQLEEESKQKEEEIAESQTLELHRTFLYQLISTIYPYKGSYISRRTGRNFGMFKISAETPMWNVLIHFAVIIFGIISILRCFSDQIVAGELLSEKWLNIIIIAGYAVSVIILFLLFLKTEIIFSSKNSEGNRKIEESELIDLYRHHVLIHKRWYNFWFYLKLVRKKHFIIVIEDLDRTQKAKSVYHFLKELRKYYVPSEQIEKDFINRVTFIVNIMPEEMLQGRIGSTGEKEKLLYDKIFDYSIHLNAVNIDNFDSVLDALLKEKIEEFNALGIKLKKENNVHEIPGMQWIIYGKELSIRQMKTRLNDAILIYESIKRKFGIDYADFEKSACVAYLRNVFQKQFYEIEDRKLDEMVLWYAKEHGDEQKFLNIFLEKEEEDKEKEENEEFFKLLYKLIKNHLVDGNYRLYFYNYPKGSKLYNMQETRVRNLILYDEELTDASETDIQIVVTNQPSVIIEALETVLELLKQLPDVVLMSEGLWKIARNHFEDNLDKLLTNLFEFAEELSEKHYNIIDSVIKFENGPQLLLKAVLVNETTIISEFRKYILERHKNYISYFVNLYRLTVLPLEKDELVVMQEVPLEYILDMTQGTVKELDEDVIDGICVRVLDEKDDDTRKKALVFYEEYIDAWKIASIIDDLIKYVNAINVFPEKIDDAIYEGIVEGDIEAETYYDIINALPLDEINNKHLERISQLDIPGGISQELCRKMKDNGFTVDYLLNMLMYEQTQIELNWWEVQNIMQNEGDKVWKKHPELFVKLREWACEQFKDEMQSLERYFKNPYPMISATEIKYINSFNALFELYDVKRAQEDKDDIFVHFCNRQFRKSDVAYAIFMFISKMDEEIIPEMFYKLDMKKVRFSLMAMTRKERVVEVLRMSLGLITSQEIVRFMKHTGSLVLSLEREIYDDLKQKGNRDLCMNYIAVVQEYGKITQETIKNIRAMPYIYAYGEVINNELYKKKYYTKYVCSKTQGEEKFTIEYDKLETLWNAYLTIFKDPETYKITAFKMYANKDFLKIVQNRQAYFELSEDSQLAMATIPQDKETLLYVLTYSDNFVVKYYSKLVGFSSKDAATTFVDIMEKHQKYAQSKEIYQNVHPKLENSQLKRRYTVLYNKANE